MERTPGVDVVPRHRPEAVARSIVAPVGQRLHVRVTDARRIVDVSEHRTQRACRTLQTRTAEQHGRHLDAIAGHNR